MFTPNATDKMYWEDPFATQVRITGARSSVFQGRTSIVLVRTIFYPEGGGQLADQGSLSLGGESFSVEDVQIDDDGVIHHILTAGDSERWVAHNGPGFADPAAPVDAVLDAARRRDHMAHHTAQHALSGAFEELARAGTTSARLGATQCTIDLDVASIGDAVVARAEDLVNTLALDDIPVTTSFPSPEELGRLPLRRAPKVESNVRVVAIGDFDVSPCGGTHCTRTGQVGAVRVVQLERSKGRIRVHFQAARRFLADARAKERALGELATSFTCGPFDVATAVERLRQEVKEKSVMIGHLRGELVTMLGERLLAAHPPHPCGTTRIVVVRPNDDLPTLRALAARLAERTDVVAVCAAPEGEAEQIVVLQRGERAAFDCGAWLKELTRAHGGRGGGRPDRAEGRLPRSARLDG